MTEVRKSTIATAGMGLFATKAFKRGARVTFMDGEVLTRPQFEERYGVDADHMAPYVIQATPYTYIDAGNGALCAYPGRYANDGGEIGSNSHFKMDGQSRATPRARPHQVSVVACRAIAPGDEIFAYYGNEYWGDVDHGRVPA